MVSKNQVDVLHPKGTNKLLAAIASERYDTHDKAIAALRTLPGVYSVDVTERTRVNKARPMYHDYAVLVIHEHPTANAHLERHQDLHTAVCRVMESYRNNPLGTDALAELELQPIDEKPVQFRDTGDATTGTLPLCKFGQGDYTTEVRG